jgi:hypothetical protein
VRPVPALDPAPPGWRTPEEEVLPRRLHRREALDPEGLARRGDALEPVLSPNPLPPLDAEPAPASARVRRQEEPLRVARLELPGPAWGPGLASPLAAASARSGTRVLAAGPDAAAGPDDASAPPVAAGPDDAFAPPVAADAKPGGEPTSSPVLDGFVPPPGAGNLGGPAPGGAAGAPGRTGPVVPLPSSGRRPPAPNIMLDGDGDDGDVLRPLGVPMRDERPLPGVDPNVPVANPQTPPGSPDGGPGRAPDPVLPLPGQDHGAGPPALPLVVADLKPSLPGPARGPGGVAPPLGPRGRQHVVVPEPGTAWLLGAGLLGLAARRRTR